MRTLFKQLGAATLLFVLAISALPAQNTAPLEAATNSATYSGSLEKPNPDKDLERTRMDIMKDLEKTRLDNEKDLEKTRMDNAKQIEQAKLDDEKQMVNSMTDRVRALAWNSWVVFGIVFVAVAYYAGNLRDKRRHETIRLMVEKGTPLTPEVLDSLRKKSRRNYDPQGYLCWGVTEVLVGMALLFAFSSGGAHVAGWIVLAVGVANLILWFIDRAHSNGGQTK